MITKEQVADLQPGDVVELHRQGWAEDVVIRGSILGDTCVGELYLGDYSLVSSSGQAPVWLEFPDTTLTVVSRAPRRLYVNHPRTEPWAGDIARDGDGDAWRYWDIGWCVADKASRNPAEGDIRQYGPLRLLWDGQTGQVAP